MKIMKSAVVVVAVGVGLGALVLAGVRVAAARGGPGGGHGPGGPPPEAYQACAGKAEGDQCSFERRDGGAMDGVCRPDRQDQEKLVCAPSEPRGGGGPGGGHGPGGPPPEAYQACAGKAEGDQCSFERRDGETMDGVCRLDRQDQEKLVCAPSEPRGGGGPGGGQCPGGPPPEAYEACAGKAEGDQCSFERRDGGAMNGVCRLDRRDETRIVCAPNGPPPGSGP